jgi:hypothetical protein
MLVRSWWKPLPYLKGDDLQGFPNKEINKSETLDMVCAMEVLKTSTKKC